MSITKAIEALKAISPEIVFLPESTIYQQIATSYLSSLEGELRPSCFALPSSKDEVSAIIKVLVSFNDDFPVAVCGAGQQPAPGVANTDGGITIHLQRLRGIQVETGRKIVTIASGETWGNVYEKTGAAGYGVSGSRASKGGIGGLATHGGLSYFSADRGFICDDVVNYELVLASGEVVNANEEENKDLWIALKGGGGSKFGIITNFTMRIFPQGNLWGGKLYYFQPSFESQIHALVDFLNGTQPDEKAHIMINLGYASVFGGIMCLNDIFYTSPKKPTVLAAFTEIQPQLEQMNTLRVDSLKGFADEQSAGAQSNKRITYMTTTLKADAKIMNSAVDKFIKAVEDIKTVTGITFAITMEPFPVSLMKQSLAKGGNSLGLNPEDGPLILVLIFSCWDEKSDDLRVQEVNIALVNAITKEAEAQNLSSPYRFLNYAFSHQDPISSYGNENKAQLQAVSRKYDPEGFFQKAVSSGFKLF